MVRKKEKDDIKAFLDLNSHLKHMLYLMSFKL